MLSHVLLITGICNQTRYDYCIVQLTKLIFNGKNIVKAKVVDIQ